MKPTYAKRTMWLLGLLMLCINTGLMAGDAKGTVSFLDSDLENAKIRAGAEGKMVFVDFYAKWCTPCKWMDQTTFRDPKVIELLNQNFISVKMNIDKSEGFEMKNKYEVQYLPTILIFNSEGAVIERIEETMNSAELLQLLNVHNANNGNKVVTNKLNASPKDMQRKYEPEDDSFTISTEDINRYRAEKKSVYRVQVGVYEEFSRASKKVSALREEFFEPVLITNDYRGEKVLFKVMLGQFATIEEAESFRKILARDFDMEGIVN